MGRNVAPEILEFHRKEGKTPHSQFCLLELSLCVAHFDSFLFNDDDEEDCDGDDSDDVDGFTIHRRQPLR